MLAAIHPAVPPPTIAILRKRRSFMAVPMMIGALRCVFAPV
jgi:hypothetical protein